MSSSIEEYFQPPEWATKEEVIKAAQHYINYWKIEAKQRNQQWLNALEENARLKAEVDALKLGSLLTAVDVLQFINLKAEVELLRASSFVTAVPVEEYEKLKAEVERLRKAGDAMQKRLIFLHDRWDSDEPNIESDAWSAAKEGKQP